MSALEALKDEVNGAIRASYGAGVLRRGDIVEILSDGTLRRQPFEQMNEVLRVKSRSAVVRLDPDGKPYPEPPAEPSRPQRCNKGLVREIKLGGERQRPLEERRDRLARLIAGVDGVVFGETIEAEGAVVFAHACRLGLEGIVSKRASLLVRQQGAIAGVRLRAQTKRKTLPRIEAAFEPNLDRSLLRQPRLAQAAGRPFDHLDEVDRRPGTSGTSSMPRSS